MECPINTPVGLDEDTGTIHNAYGEIELRTVYDLGKIDEQQDLLKYIVTAINGYKKLVDNIKHIDLCLDMMQTDIDCNVPLSLQRIRAYIQGIGAK